MFIKRHGRKEMEINEKVGKECSKGEHEEEGHGAVLQAFQRKSELLCEALARVCEVIFPLWFDI